MGSSGAPGWWQWQRAHPAALLLLAVASRCRCTGKSTAPLASTRARTRSPMKKGASRRLYRGRVAGTATPLARPSHGRRAGRPPRGSHGERVRVAAAAAVRRATGGQRHRGRGSAGGSLVADGRVGPSASSRAAAVRPGWTAKLLTGTSNLSKNQASPRVFRQGYHPSIIFGYILVPVRYFDASPILILANGTWPDTRNIESPRVSESTTRILNSAEADTLDSVPQCGAVTT